MSLIAYIWAVRLLTGIVFITLGGVIFFLDPETIGPYAEILFFSVAGFLVFGLSVLLVTGLYRMTGGDEATLKYLGSALRQAFLLTLALFALYFLWRVGLLLWWTGALLAAFILLLEMTLRQIFRLAP